MKVINQNKQLIIVFLLLLPFLIGIFYPELFWNTNQLSLLGKTNGFVLFWVLSFMGGYFYFKDTKIYNTKINSRLLFASIAVIFGLIYYYFPMAFDFYGDSKFLIQDTDILIKNYDNKLVTELLNPHVFDTKTGVKTYYEMSNFFGWLTQTNGVETSKVIGAVFGGIFAFFWLNFVKGYIAKLHWQISFSLLGLICPISLVFMGHYETYFLSYTAILIWVSCLGIYFKSQKKVWLYLLPFIFIFLLKTHITNWLFLPSLVFVYIHFFRKKTTLSLIQFIDNRLKKSLKNYQGILSLKGGIIYVFIPFLILLLILYFFIYENYNGPRTFSESALEKALFLPLQIEDKPLLNRYNLFSFNHIWDYIQLWYTWSGGVLLIIISSITIYRKKINWNSPFLFILIVTALLFLTAYFFLNPLLSLPIDWDLFASPGLILLPLAVILVGKLERKVHIKPLIGFMWVFIFLGGLHLYAHYTPTLLTKKMEYTGYRTFKTYWLGTSTNFIKIAQLKKTTSAKIDVYEKALKELKPYTILGEDYEYAHLFLKLGDLYKKKGNVKKAIQLYEEGYRYSPTLGTLLFSLMVTHFEEKNFSKSYQYATKLVDLRYQPYERTLRIGIHVSLAAKQYQSAANYATTHIKYYGGTRVIKEVEKRLRTGDRVESLIYLFKNK